MEIVRQIYRGDYRPADTVGVDDPEYQEATRKIHQEYERFKAALAEGQQPELEKLMELNLNLLVYGCEAAFIQGARAGARLAVDLLAEDL